MSRHVDAKWANAAVREAANEAKLHAWLHSDKLAYYDSLNKEQASLFNSINYTLAMIPLMSGDRLWYKTISKERLEQALCTYLSDPQFDKVHVKLAQFDMTKLNGLKEADIVFLIARSLTE